jgi:hypothetical protein
MDKLANQVANQGPGNGTSEVVELPRRPGAPKGRAKPEGSGRQKGTRNRVTKEIAEIAQKHGKAIVDGLVKEFKTTGDLDVKVKIATLVLSYGYGQPLRRAELSGPGGRPIKSEHTRVEIRDDRELARRLSLVLARALPREIEAEVATEPAAAPPALTNDHDKSAGAPEATADAPAEPELLWSARSDQWPSPPPLPEVRRGHENRGRRR